MTEGRFRHPDPAFDPEALREKYRQERDRRLREGGEDQYVETSSEYSHYAHQDPYAPPGFNRDPITDDVTVLVIGGGFGGLIAAARLQQAGIHDIRIMDSASDFGGTWYWNRYPGAQCDIESYCYLPLLEETGYVPREKYSFAPEIFEHAQRIARTFSLYEHAIFQTWVTELRWMESDQRWRIETNRNDSLTARFVVLATGPANRGKLPGIPGIQDFKGHSFHTNRWDYAYTGGDHGGNLHRLADRNVAIIGTGATAIQCVPHLGAFSKHLYVVQRTPSSVDLRRNRPTDPDWAKNLQSGWQVERQENFDNIFMGNPVDADLIDDSWTRGFHSLRSFIPVDRELPAGEVERLMELADFRKMNQLRDRVGSIVKDESTAEALKPWYRLHCKRPTFNDDYLPTFNRPNVTLLDTSGQRGLERITESGIVSNGTEYPVDCIIYATGFETGTAFRRRIGFGIFGEDGRSLYDHWAQGMRTLHGHSTHGFPNWFFVGPSQNGATMNYSFIVDSQAGQIAYIIGEVLKRGATRVQPTAQAEAEWVATIRRLSVDNTKFLQACTPGYFNNEGEFGQRAPLYEFYAPGAVAFRKLLADWRSRGNLEGLEL